MLNMLINNLSIYNNIIQIKIKENVVNNDKNIYKILYNFIYIYLLYYEDKLQIF
jgi:hypothetical protein